MSSLTKILVVAVLTAVAAGFPRVWAEEAQLSSPAQGAGTGETQWVAPKVAPAEVQTPEVQIPKPEPKAKKPPSPPAWETREGLEESARRVLSVPLKVWEGMVKGRRVTRVIVRERGRARVIYAGPSLTKQQVENLIAQWAKTAGLASKSFAEVRDRKVLAEAKEYTDLRFKPLEKRVSALERKQSQVQKAGQVTNWLALALVLLMIVIGGCIALWRRPRWRQVMY